MSMMRASGAMPAMTARQIAAASLAVPKSVMNTIVGAGFAGGASGWANAGGASVSATKASSRNAGSIGSSGTGTRAPRVLLAEADREAVAVLDLIVSALQPQPAPLARPGLASGLEQLVPRRHLGPD